jgi:hypothetical protein
VQTPELITKEEAPPVKTQEELMTDIARMWETKDEIEELYTKQEETVKSEEEEEEQPLQTFEESKKQEVTSSDDE